MAKEEEEELVILESADDEIEGGVDGIVELELEGTGDLIEEELLKLQNEENSANENSNNKKFLIIGLLSSVVLFLIIIGLILLFSQKKSADTTNDDTDKIVKNIQKKENSAKFSPSKVENMLQRANALYERGKKIEALNIYKNIANFNESLSNYNMGVAQMRENSFKDAIESFKKAIVNQENRTISALNAAICALRLEDEKLFESYLDLAYTYLPEESNSPLYSYYVGLINFYKGNYYESLSALTHPSSSSYKERQAYVSSKIYTFLGSQYLALDAIQLFEDKNNIFSEGLLYANIGEYVIAKDKLQKAIKDGYEAKKAQLALALVDMKLGNFEDASNTLRDNFEKEPTFTVETYPIKTVLSATLFDVNRAQSEFVNTLFYSKPQQYAMLFYFAPYKVFNAKQTMEIIRKGSINIFLDETKEAKEYLNTSSTISKVNALMSEGIKNALNHRVLEANEDFKKLLKIYPKHPILHYNLALTYARLGNYSASQKHFSTSYHLDPKNYLAGLFAAMSLELIGKSNEKLLEDIKLTLNEDNSEETMNFNMTLVHLMENNHFSMNRWLERDKNSTSPLHIIFDVITAKLIGNTTQYLQNAKKLEQLLPQDIMSNIISFHAKNENKDIKSYAKEIQMDFFKRQLDMDGFYYGSQIAKEQYVKFLQISGLIFKEREKLKQRLAVEQRDIVGVMQALAYLNIYTNNFEESYTLYNALIDEHNQQDTNTIFLGAAASIGANHPENAIALLELSKLIDPNNLESRYALGLLYQEVKNYKGATTQYSLIGNTGFKSKYFDFKIVK